MLSVEMVMEKLAEIGNKRFTVWFVKKDGTERKMICQRGVTKHLMGGHSTIEGIDDLIGVYEIGKGYRCFDRNRVLRLRSGALDTDNG